MSAIAQFSGATPDGTMCHHAGPHPSCRGVESALFTPQLALKGAALFNPGLTPAELTAALQPTFEDGIDAPDLGTGSWACDALDHCNLKLPLSRIIGQPDAVDLVPFESFTDFTNPSLLGFFILEGLDSTLAPASLLCTRTPVTARQAGFYNRLYSSVHVRNVSCGNKDEYGRWNHEPAQQNQSCKTDQDCCNLDPSYCDPQFVKLDICKNGRCDFNNAYACQNSSWCFPWEECAFVARAGRNACIPIGTCGDSNDPFSRTVCPVVRYPFKAGTVATYCNGNECWRQ